MQGEESASSRLRKQLMPTQGFQHGEPPHAFWIASHQGWLDTTLNVQGDLTVSGKVTHQNAFPGYGQIVTVHPTTGAGDYTTLSAALAAITDASASKVYGIIVYGAITETADVTFKSHIHILGMPGASVTIDSAAGASYFTVYDKTNITVRGLKLVRLQANTTYYSCLHTGGTADNTVRFENCEICVSGGANLANALIHGDDASASETDPIFDNCRFYSTNAAVWTAGHAKGTFTGCKMYGGTAMADGSGHGVVTTWHSEPTFIACDGFGGNGAGFSSNDYSKPHTRGCNFTAGATGSSGGELKNGSAGTHDYCTFIGCPGVASSPGLSVSSGAPTLNHCNFIGGNGGTSCHGLVVNNNAAPTSNNCTTTLPRETASPDLNGITETCTFVASTKPVQIASIYIGINTPGDAGATVSIGTTLGGTDIVNAAAIDTGSAVYPALGAGALLVHAASTTFYITVNGTGSPVLVISFQMYISYASCNGLTLNTIGAAAFHHCDFIANAAGGYGVRCNTVAVNANVARFDNCHIETRAKDTASNAGVSGQSQWDNAPFRHCTVIGGWASITPIGGARQTLEGWYQSNVAANQGWVALDRIIAVAGQTKFMPIRAGSVTGISVWSNGARSAGTLIVKVYVDGSTGNLSATIDGTNTTYKASTQAVGITNFNAGSNLTINIQTSADWAPDTADIWVCLEVEWDG